MNPLLSQMLGESASVEIQASKGAALGRVLRHFFMSKLVEGLSSWSGKMGLDGRNYHDLGGELIAVEERTFVIQCDPEVTQLGKDRTHMWIGGSFTGSLAFGRSSPRIDFSHRGSTFFSA